LPLAFLAFSPLAELVEFSPLAKLVLSPCRTQQVLSPLAEFQFSHLAELEF
jgi:hypothetical protein